MVSVMVCAAKGKELCMAITPPRGSRMEDTGRRILAGGTASLFVQTEIRNTRSYPSTHLHIQTHAPTYTDMRVTVALFQINTHADRDDRKIK